MDSNADIRAKIDRMAEIKRQQDKLKTELSTLDAFFVVKGMEDLTDKKSKSISYFGETAKITFTKTETLKVEYGAYLQQIFGDAFSDSVTVETKYKISKPASRMMGGLWTKNYLTTSIAEEIKKIPIDDAARKTLAKKLKGINYDSDKENLVNIGGLSEADAEDYAFLVYEAAVWESFLRLMKLNKIESAEAMDEIINLIAGAFMVEETTKTALVLLDE